MERVIILAPALVPVAYFLGALVIYSGMVVLGQRPNTGESRKQAQAAVLDPTQRLVLGLLLAAATAAPS